MYNIWCEGPKRFTCFTRFRRLWYRSFANTWNVSGEFAGQLAPSRHLACRPDLLVLAWLFCSQLWRTPSNVHSDSVVAGCGCGCSTTNEQFWLWNLRRSLTVSGRWTWWTHGEHMVNTWWTHGEHMVNTWWTHGEHSVTWDLWSLNVKLCRCWSLCHLAFAGRWKMLDPEFCSFLIKVGPNCPNWSKLNLSTFILRICICNYLHIFCILYTIYLSYCTVPLTASLACSTLAVLSRSWVWAEVTYHDQVLCNTIRATFTINWSMVLAIDGVYDRVCQPDGYLGRS